MRKIAVSARNIWFLERSIPLLGMLDFFPPDAVGPPAYGRGGNRVPAKCKLTIETDRGWSFSSDITADSKVLRNSSRNRGSGKWVVEAGLKAGDFIVIEKLDDYRYRLTKESGNTE